MSVARAQGAPTTHPVRVLKCPGRFCLFSTLTEYKISRRVSLHERSIARGSAERSARLAPPPPPQQPEMLTAALALAVAHSHVAVRGLDDDSCWATTLLSATSIAGAVALPVASLLAYWRWRGAAHQAPVAPLRGVRLSGEDVSAL